MRQYVLNSGGRLSSINLRKVVMGVLANNAIPPLRSGELAEEEPIDTHFDPTLPYCGVLSSLSSSVELAATASPEVRSPPHLACEGRGIDIAMILHEISNYRGAGDDGGCASDALRLH